MQAQAVTKLLDRKAKISHDEFSAKLGEIFSTEGNSNSKTKEFETLISSQNFEEFVNHIGQTASEHQGIVDIRSAITGLENLGITNVVFDQSLMRGFDYYTGIVFEVFDKHPDNRRALFGGGRYDELLAMFGGDKLPAVGFGMGDITIENALETYGLLPKPVSEGGVLPNPIDLYICVMSVSELPFAQDLAQRARSSKKNYKTSIDYSLRKIGDQIRSADRSKARYVAVIGADEVKTGKVKYKELLSGAEVDLEV